MPTIKILLYVPDVDDKKLAKRLADVIYIASKYGKVQLLVTVQPMKAPGLKWDRVWKDKNDRTGETTTWASVDPSYFAATFPNAASTDIVAAYISRDDWYRSRPELDFYQVGRTVEGPNGDFVFTDPKGVKYDIGGEHVDPWTWIFLHELSHVVYIDFMAAPDPTHFADYQKRNLIEAIKGWDFKRRLLARLLDLYQALLALLIKQKETMPTPAPAPAPAPAKDPLDRLIQALIQVESDGYDRAIGDHHLAQKAYGPMQIREPVCIDVNRVFGTKLTATDMLGNRPLSIDTFKKYMSIYATRARLGFEPTDEVRARIWNGGPAGWKKAATEPYWRKVSKALAALPALPA